jgi:WD40 repeat protein
MLAVGSHDNDIYIYRVNGTNYDFHGKLSAHKSFITNMDWSRDGRYIQSNCGAYEYLFFDVQNKKQIASGATQLRDEKWASYTVKLGWWVQGIFPPATSGDHVNGVDRNHGENVIATGDDWGFVNLYGMPNSKGAKFKAYRAHASHVVRVMWDKSDSYLYSIGGYDKTLMKWKVV